MEGALLLLEGHNLSIAADRVATHLENLAKSGILRVAREKSWKVCSWIWSIAASIDLEPKCALCKKGITRYSCASHEV